MTIFSTDPSADPPANPGDRRTIRGADVLVILLSAFLVVLMMNATLVYFATDEVSDFRALIEWLC